jgi:hypothetical protein
MLNRITALPFGYLDFQVRTADTVLFYGCGDELDQLISLCRMLGE